jgi:hypothetical protein
MQATHNLPTTFGKYTILPVIGEASKSAVPQAFYQRKGDSYAIKSFVSIIQTLSN